MEPLTLSAAEARAVALSAQGVTGHESTGHQNPGHQATGGRPGLAALRELTDRLRVLQIDPINVLARGLHTVTVDSRGDLSRELSRGMPGL